MIISSANAWKLALKIGKTPPYRGYSLDLGGGLVMVHHPKTAKYHLIDFPITPEKVEKFELENKEMIEALPTPNPEKLLKMIREISQIKHD